MATLFIWQRVEHMTDNWHPAAGVVAIGETLEAALALVMKAQTMKARTAASDDPIGIGVPDVVRDGVDGPEGCWVFPDAGCC